MFKAQKRLLISPDPFFTSSLYFSFPVSFDFDVLVPSSSPNPPPHVEGNHKDSEPSEKEAHCNID